MEELPRFPKGTKELVDAFGYGALWLETRYWRGLGIKRDPLPLMLQVPLIRPATLLPAAGSTCRPCGA